MFTTEFPTKILLLFYHTVPTAGKQGGNLGCICLFVSYQFDAAQWPV